MKTSKPSFEYKILHVRLWSPAHDAEERPDTAVAGKTWNQRTTPMMLLGPAFTRTAAHNQVRKTNKDGVTSFHVMLRVRPSYVAIECGRHHTTHEALETSS